MLAPAKVFYSVRNYYFIFIFIFTTLTLSGAVIAWKNLDKCKHTLNGLMKIKLKGKEYSFSIIEPTKNEL